MFTVKVRPTLSLDVVFAYNRAGPHGVTYCELYNSDEDYQQEQEPLAIDCAVCRPPDNFCKETGRKIALRRALDIAADPAGLALTKAERELVWRAYLQRRIPTTNQTMGDKR